MDGDRGSIAITTRLYKTNSNCLFILIPLLTCSSLYRSKTRYLSLYDAGSLLHLGYMHFIKETLRSGKSEREIWPVHTRVTTKLISRQRCYP